MDLTPRPVRDSQVIKTELVVPNDTNQLGNLLGGRLLHWIDIAAALVAMRHSGRVCVTASVDAVGFLAPIKLGHMVVLKASLNRVFNTSLEIGVRIEAEAPGQNVRVHASSAYLTFVGIDEQGRPLQAAPVVPDGPEEIRRYEQALIRRENRLLQRRQLDDVR